MKANHLYALIIAALFLIFLIGKVYAQSTYPVAAEIHSASPLPFSENSTTNNLNQKISIWAKH